MPPLRPLFRQFTLPQSLPSSSTTSPMILSITAQTAPSRTSFPAHFSTTAPIRSGDAHGAHESHYDPPSGWLFGVPPGEKYKKEGWENVWVWGFWGSIGLTVVAYAYKPDSSIQTWALEEARRRLEAEGILPDPTASSPTNSS